MGLLLVLQVPLFSSARRCIGDSKLSLGMNSVVTLASYPECIPISSVPACDCVGLKRNNNNLV